MRLIIPVLLISFLFVGCSNAQRAQKVVTTVEPLVASFIQQKKVNIINLATPLVCSPEVSAKLKMEVDPLYTYGKDAVEDPSSVHLVELGTLIYGLYNKILVGDIKLDECQMTLSSVISHANML